MSRPDPHQANPAPTLTVTEAENILLELGDVFFAVRPQGDTADVADGPQHVAAVRPQFPTVEARYQTLVEQIPAVIFMAFLDERLGEAYVSPQIEAMLGFSQTEWLNDPVRWYQQIHPDDKARWSLEAAEMFLSGKPLKSTYRVLARDGHVVSFHCEAKMVRGANQRPWFIHGVAFDVTDLKRAEEALQEERNFAAAVLDTVGSLIMVLDPAGRIVRFNRSCELTMGRSADEVRGRRLWNLFPEPHERQSIKAHVLAVLADQQPREYETYWTSKDGGADRLIAWSLTVLSAADGSVAFIIATGIDITEKKRLERAILDISGREQRRIGQDLHDGLGQHLTGVAFLSKVLEQKLSELGLSEAADAAQISTLVNDAIKVTRELAKGLVPVEVEALGLMSALERWAAEIEHVYKLSCEFECDDPVFLHDNVVATHLYRIAQEAVTNAVKHGRGRHVHIRLTALDSKGMLTIEDDGCGFREGMRTGEGMGLHIMLYRAQMIGASFDIAPRPGGGTLVTCLFPRHIEED